MLVGLASLTWVSAAGVSVRGVVGAAVAVGVTVGAAVGVGVGVGVGGAVGVAVGLGRFLSATVVSRSDGGGVDVGVSSGDLVSRAEVLALSRTPA